MHIITYNHSNILSDYELTILLQCKLSGLGAVDLALAAKPTMMAGNVKNTSTSPNL